MKKARTFSAVIPFGGAAPLRGTILTIATIALLRTQWIPKGAPNALLDERIKQHGHPTLLIDTGVQGEPRLKPGFSRNEVADAARRHRGPGFEPRPWRDGPDDVVGAPVLLSRLVAEGKTDGVIAFGWSGCRPWLKHVA